MLASTEPSIEIVRLLLAAGADTKLQNYGGRTALDLARIHGCTEAIVLLEAAMQG